MSDDWLGTGAGRLKYDLTNSGLIEGNLLAAGQLRQGKTPSLAKILTGLVLIDILGPRRSKSLPRNFVLAVTDRGTFAFKANSGRRTTEHGPYLIRMRTTAEREWPVGRVSITDLEIGEESKGGTLQILTDAGIEEVPVFRPNFSGDPDTDELLKVLSA